MTVQYIGTSISGLAADTKPTPSGNERGLIFVETDTNNLYQWDTDSWNQVAGADVALGSETTGNYVATIAGTANEIEISGSGSEGATVTIGIPTNPTLGGNVTISGDLTVSGTTTTVSSTTITINDSLISLAANNTSADAVDIGIYGTYDTSGSQDLFGGFFRDADDSGKWKLFKDLQAAPTTTVNTSGTGYAVGILVATLEGNVTGNVTGNADTVTNGVYTTGNQTIAGTKTFSSTISGNISGSSGSTTGNAATVTNGVYTTGAQTISGNKTFSSTITGDISGSSGSTTGNAAAVTNGVYTVGNQTIGGTKTFSLAIVGDITGNSATVTDGVYTAGNQTIAGVKTFSSAIAGDITGSSATVTNGVYTTGTQTIGGAKTFSSDMIISYDGSPSLSFTDAASHSWKIGTKNADNNFYIIDGSSNDIAKFGTVSVQLNKGLLVEGTNNAATRDNARFKSQRTTGNATYLRIGRYGTGDDGTMFIGNNYNRNSGFAADNTSVGVSSIKFNTDGSLNFQTAAAGTAQPTDKLTISAAGLTTMSGGFSSTGDSSFGVSGTGVDVNFYGNTSGRDLMWDASDNRLEFKDQAYMSFGDGNDFQIFHNGSNTYLDEGGTGALIARTNILSIRNAADTGTLLYTEQAGSVDLYHNGSKKFETTATGATVTGALDIAGGELKLSVGQNTIRTNAAYMRRNSATGDIHFDSQASVRVNLDTNADNTDKKFSIGANASTSDVFSVSETGQVTIAGGGPGADKVLTSDANGLATWEDAAGGGGFGTSYAINSFFGKNRN